MKVTTSSQHRVKQASLAIFAALAAPAALAGVTATQLPGVGYVVNGSSVTSTNSNDTLTIKNGAGTVIQWGGSSPSATSAATINASGTAGFNVGSSATVKFSGSAVGASVLNIDASGNPSEILGNLTANSDTSVFVANANGIVVGGGAVISAPEGLGLINADLNNKNAIAAFTAASTILFSPSGAVGGVSIASTANLNAVDGFLDVAGAGNVNVDGGFVSSAGALYYNIPSSIPVSIVAGMEGTIATANGGYSQTSSFTDPGVNSGNKVSLSSASGNANLNLGTSTSPYDATNLQVVANGNVSLASTGNLTNVKAGTLEWTGTATNAGILNFGAQTGTTLTPTTNPASFQSFFSAGNSTAAVLGSLVNTGTINAGGLYFSGSSFSNSGAIQLGQGSNVGPSVTVITTQGDINLGGTLSVVAANSTYTGNLYLSDMELYASSMAGQNVSISTSPITVSGGGNAYVEATNVNVGSSIAVQKTGFFEFSPYGAATPVSGAFTLASSASITAANLYMGGASVNNGRGAQSPYKAMTSYNLVGSLVAAGTTNAPGSVNFGNSSATNSSSPFNIQGAGSITTGNLNIDNLQGAVNNITTGQILANGFQLNAPKGGTMAISVTAAGAKPQGFNVKVNGNATINSGNTMAVGLQTPGGNTGYTQYLYPANANSNLVVQTTGDLTVNAGNKLNPYSIDGATFQWPGLVYFLANGNLTSNTSIANAYGAQAQVGAAGVFMISKNITDNYPIYTNGNSGVVFAAPFDASKGIYPYASTINGVDPTTAATMPLVYFAQPNSQVGNSNFSLQPLGSFTNENGVAQENQTFLTLAQTK